MSDIVDRKPHAAPISPGWFYARRKGERLSPEPRKVISTVRRGHKVWINGNEVPLEDYEWFGPVPVCNPV